MNASPSSSRSIVAALVLASTLAGCSLLGSPAPDASRYFVLSSIGAPGAPDAAVRAPGVHLGLGPVKLPAYLDSQALVRAGASGQVDHVPDAYWAEPLSLGFPRALLHRTAALLGTPHAVAYPWYSTTRVDWKVTVDVLRFEARPGGGAVLVARWSVVRPSDGTPVAGAESSFEEGSGAGAGDVVAAMSTCVDRLAAGIAAHVARAGASAPTAAPASRRPGDTAPSSR